MGNELEIIIVIFFIIMLNIRDFNNLLNKGRSAYIQNNSGMIASNMLLMALGMFLEIEDIAVIFVSCVIYTSIYTLIFFKIKKIKKERDKEEEWEDDYF